MTDTRGIHAFGAREAILRGEWDAYLNLLRIAVYQRLKALRTLSEPPTDNPQEDTNA